MTTPTFSYTELLGGARHVEGLIEELREDLTALGITPDAVNAAAETLRELLNAERV